MTRVRLVLASLLATSAILVSSASAQDSGYEPYPANSDQQQQGALDEPGRPVARLSLMNGEASVRRGDSGDWVAASVNAPLMVQDSVSVAPGGYVEVQFDGGNFVSIAGDSEARISTLDNGRFGVQVIKGMVTYRVLRPSNAQSEVATPQVAVRPGQNSAIRVEVLPEGYSRITVRAGEMDVYTPRGVEKVRAGGMMMVRGDASDPEYQITEAAALDEWDRFNERRDQDLLATRSSQYVSRDMYGTEDLDRNGRWVNDPQYGNVWSPNEPADWAPYRNGRWVWEDYYGWTWVAYEPWGWAPYHYGSWYYRGGGFGWCWFPGRPYERVFWRPALVAFFGFGGWHGGLSVGAGFGGGIGWVPLAPYERFHPWYGRGWYGGRNVVNNVTIVNNTNITNIYRNARVSNGVSGLGAREFAGGQFRGIQPLGAQNLRSANLVRGALPMQPSQSHLAFSNRAAAANVPHINPVAQQRFASTGFSSPRSFSAAGGTGQSYRTPFAQQQSSFANTNRNAQFGRPAAQTGTNSGSNGWQRFGSTQQAAPSGSSASRSSDPRASAPGWQRFGTPQRSTGGETRPSSPSQNWNSFGRPSNLQTSPQRNFAPSAPQESGQRGYSGAPSAPRYSAPQNYGRALQIAPPMVQQRYQSAPQQRYQQSAPPQRYQQSAPQQRYQQSAPQQQQRSAPSYGRPSGGGGGGGNARPSGGGGGGHAPSSGHGRR